MELVEVIATDKSTIGFRFGVLISREIPKRIENSPSFLSEDAVREHNGSPDL